MHRGLVVAAGLGLALLVGCGSSVEGEQGDSGAALPPDAEETSTPDADMPPDAAAMRRDAAIAPDAADEPDADTVEPDASEAADGGALDPDASIALDAGGNPADAATADAPPTVAFTSPKTGDQVKGAVVLRVSASDDVGVKNVVLKVNGKALTTLTSAPYAFTWNSCAVADGPATLDAVAQDTAGQSTTASVSVTVANGAVAPLLHGIGGATRAQLTVDTCGGDSTYDVYWSNTPGVTTASSTFAATTRSAAHIGLTNYKRYYYRVAAKAGPAAGMLSREILVVPGLGACSAGGWCWDSPRPQGHSYNDVWVRAADDAWAVGDSGTLLRWDGTAWTAWDSGTTESLRGIFGTGPDDAWAVGSGGVILHWDGSAWTKVASGVTDPLESVWASGPDDAWAVGGDSGHAVTLHWNGTSWTTTSNVSASSHDLRIWGRAPDQIWSAGMSGGVSFWDGRQWKSTGARPSGSGYVYGLWATSPTDLWIATQFGVFRWDGTNTTQSIAGAFRGVWGTSKTDVWAVGDSGLVQHWNGTAWKAMNTGNERGLRSISGTAAGDPWMVGEYGELHHVSGTTRTRVTVGMGAELSDVSARAANDVWASGGTRSTNKAVVLHWNGAAWSETVFSNPGVWHTFGVWGVSATDAWAVGVKGSIFRYDGTKWSSVASGSMSTLHAVWGAGASDVWAANDTSLLHWNGTAWKPGSAQPTCSLSIERIWSFPSTPGPWVVCGDGVFRYDGTTWARQLSISPSVYLSSIWGSSATDVWAVGSTSYTSGVFQHLTGGKWTDATPAGGVSGAVNGVWGTGASDVWAVTSKGETLHWNGTAWKSVESGTTRTLDGISGSSATDIRVAGEGGLQRYVP